MLDLSGLNGSQNEAVTTIEGVIQVCSVAGSGKTRVLTYRVGHMIENVGIDPKNIYVSTFTKKAAEELKLRLAKLIGKEKADMITAGTFHSIGYRILKFEYKRMDDKLKDFTLLDNAKMLMIDILKKFNITYTNEMVFLSKIEHLKNQLITPEHLIMDVLTNSGDSQFDKDFPKVYDEYERRKDEQCMIDFNDMIYKLYYLFVYNPEILAKYQKRFQYLLIDEAQDCNHAQYELIKLLGAPQDNIFLVGDDDQSIYKWRGAESEQFINFKNNYPQLQRINLEENYRSRPHILRAANSLIGKNTVRLQKTLKPQRNSNNGKVNTMSLKDEESESKYVADKISELERARTPLKDIAILYRTNSQARAIEDALIGASIPYVVEGGMSFYNRAEVADILAYLKLTVNTDDNRSLERIINKPSRYLGKKFMEELSAIAKQRRISLFGAIDYLPMGKRVNHNAKDFKGIITRIQGRINRMAMDKADVGDIIANIINFTGYDKFLSAQSNEEDDVKSENLAALIAAGNKHKSIEGFVRYINIVTNPRKNSFDTVKLMTLHKAKGLEFPTVFMIGVSNGLLPHRHAMDNEMDVEEERRLGYVGITRAMDDLYITSIQEYLHKPCMPSRFIAEAALALDHLTEEEEERLMK